MAGLPKASVSYSVIIDGACWYLVDTSLRCLSVSSEHLVSSPNNVSTPSGGPIRACTRRQSPPRFDAAMLGSMGTSGPEYYWSELEKGKYQHKVNRDLAWKKYRANFIPLLWHSDETEVYTMQPYSVYQYASALTDCTNPYDFRMFALSLETARKYENETDDEVVDYWLWNIGLSRSLANYSKRPK